MNNLMKGGNIEKQQIYSYLREMLEKLWVTAMCSQYHSFLFYCVVEI